MDTFMQISVIAFYASGALAVITTVIGFLSWRHLRKGQKALRASIDWTPSRGHSSDTPLS